MSITLRIEQALLYCEATGEPVELVRRHYDPFEDFPCWYRLRERELEISVDRGETWGDASKHRIGGFLTEEYVPVAIIGEI